MALQSPGVQVTVIDESFYTPAEPGTTPLIVVATAQDKTNGAGTGIAAGTTKANAGKAYKLTSQRDLTELFGVPFFEKTASSTPVHGSERNEYGLLAAYSLLGVSNAAFIVRADVNLDELEAQTSAPGANPANGQWWFNTSATTYGIQEWNGAAASTTGGQKFANKIPTVLTDDDYPAKIDGNVPKESVGQIGDYAVVFRTVEGDGTFGADQELVRYYYKSAGNGITVDAGQWVLLGSNDWQASHPAVVGTTTVSSVITLSSNIYLNGALIGSAGASYSAATLVTQMNTGSGGNAIVSGTVARAVNGKLYVYTDGTTSADGSTEDGSLYFEGAGWNQFGITPGTVDIGSGITRTGGLIDKIAGLYFGPGLHIAPHTSIPGFKTSDKNPRPTGSVWVKTTEPNNGARYRASKWSSATTSWVSYEAPIYETTHAALYSLDRTGGGANIGQDALFIQYNAEENSGFDTSPQEATFRVWRRSAVGTTTITSDIIKANTYTLSTAYTFTLAESLAGEAALDTAKTISFTGAGNSGDADTIAARINAAGFTNIVASVAVVSETTSRLVISHTLGGDFRLTEGTNTPLNNIFTPFNISTRLGTANFFNLSDLSLTGGQSAVAPGASEDYLATGWKPLAAEDPRFAAAGTAPLAEPSDGQLWYNPNFAEVDIMVHNGETWVGYRHTTAPYPETEGSSRTGYAPVVSASNPYVDGETTDGDLWISTADLENFPTIYRYNSNLTDVRDDAEKWELVDKTDQTTEEGVLFADARWATEGTADTASTIEDLLHNNFLDFDAPDPALYPKGMLLWNLRRSGGNVKKYVNNYINTTTDNPRTSTDTLAGNAFESGSGLSMADYWTDRWVTASPNNEDGSGTFGRKAQRAVVVAALKSVVDTSSEIRDEERRNFNLIAAPGYPELMSNLVNLNIDRGVTAFVIGDTPLRLPDDATSLTNWGTNAELVTDNGDNGIVTYDEYLACYYPNGYTTDLSGTGAVVPASHMMLKTIALSDNVSYPWFAPAGTRRGGITNATAVGYIDSLSGEFQTVALNEGQRDTLYDLKLNPIPFFNGVGLVAYGQKTRARNASALDRINVARLVVYLRSQLNKLARPYIFEPNDKITRDEIKQACESLLLELVGLRALYDFAVVCDESNNTPARIDRNELYVDIAIEPVKAVEFIYIPLRVKNTGEI